MEASLIDGALSVPGRPRLQRLFSAFPSGWPGIGLIVLRIAVALGAIAHGFYTLTSPDGPAFMLWPTGLLAILVGFALLIGFLTPLAGAAATIGYAILGVSRLLATTADQDSGFTALSLAVMSIALVLLGPGAVSLDARLFGRREIIIPEGRRTPRG
jgi:uncharacterized membrane protein YphA (DoxX/SURF4 family)